MSLGNSKQPVGFCLRFARECAFRDVGECCYKVCLAAILQSHHPLPCSIMSFTPSIAVPRRLLDEVVTYFAAHNLDVGPDLRESCSCCSVLLASPDISCFLLALSASLTFQVLRGFGTPTLRVHLMEPTYTLDAPPVSDTAVGTTLIVPAVAITRFIRLIGSVTDIVSSSAGIHRPFCVVFSCPL